MPFGLIRRKSSAQQAPADSLQVAEARLTGYYEAQGYRVDRASAAEREAGIDLILQRESERLLLQYRHWNDAQVSNNAVHQLLALLSGHGADGAVLVTAGQFTSAALKAAARAPAIRLIDSDTLGIMLGESKVTSAPAEVGPPGDHAGLQDADRASAGPACLDAAGVAPDPAFVPPGVSTQDAAMHDIAIRDFAMQDVPGLLLPEPEPQPEPTPLPMAPPSAQAAAALPAPAAPPPAELEDSGGDAHFGFGRRLPGDDPTIPAATRRNMDRWVTRAVAVVTLLLAGWLVYDRLTAPSVPETPPPDVPMVKASPLPKGPALEVPSTRAPTATGTAQSGAGASTAVSANGAVKSAAGSAANLPAARPSNLPGRGSANPQPVPGQNSAQLKPEEAIKVIESSTPEI